MNTQEKIGLVIKLLRTERNLSQEQLSAQCGIDQHYISNLECGQRNASIEIIERIASFFNMPLSQFFSSVESIKERRASVSEVSLEDIEQRFVRFMEAQKLSDKTIRKYSLDTPNNESVQQIIKKVTGFTKNMYSVLDTEALERIIALVAASDFDKIGHSMYSSGIKKFKLFLEYN